MAMNPNQPMQPGQPAQQQVQVTFPDALKAGVYSNVMIVSHTKEEFVFDFLMITPPGAGPSTGVVTARIITSPGHMKRMVSALTENLRIYESNFGKISEATEPPKPRMGFQH
jgi:Protein of unknown function (DUF3467)